MDTFSLCDLEQMFNYDLSSISSRILARNFDFRFLTPKESIHEISSMKTTLNNSLVKSGPNRYSEWEKGWLENRDIYKSNSIKNSLIPKYFGKNPILRLNRKLIMAMNSSVEYNFFETLLDYIYLNYIRGFNNLYEFGCGTSHNLVRIRELDSYINLVGLDWTISSIDLGKLLKQKYNIDNLNFNFFDPDFNTILENNSVVLTVAALEQTGKQFYNFVDYLLKSKIKRIINIEPINELLDEYDPLDHISITYCNKRNYLSGYLSYLQQLERQTKIKIISAKRSYIGSRFLEGYSIVVWEI